MADISLGDLMALILTELADTFDQTAKPADLFKLHASDATLDPPEEILKLHVSELDLDLPAHLQLQVDPLSPTQAARLMVTFPSTLDTSTISRLGRIRITIKPEPLLPSEEPR
jgi:hypothetical protein